jgi:TATA-box binding protein (TBP) (component of TFIID and TFIIIB)
MASLNDEWENFTINSKSNLKITEKKKPEYTVKCSDIYISTKTKIAFLNKTNINLESTFWNIPILDYWLPQSGILKKSMKFNCCNIEETTELNEKIDKEKNISCDIIKNIITDTKYKDVRKIDIGISKKDLNNFRKKKKGAFYNCFAIILRIIQNNVFKEVHIKIFNTGKLEIPGIQDDNTLIIALNDLSSIMSKILNTNVSYNEKQIENVLINSNFSCGFYINRQKLHQLLKFKYNIHSLYDPCSYPGIQCKFYYNPNECTYNGVCDCKNKCYNLKKKEKEKRICREISFMIFRTGSVLIVGHCDENILKHVYEFLKNIFITQYANISQNINVPPKKKKIQPKIRKKKIKVSI